MVVCCGGAEPGSSKQSPKVMKVIQDTRQSRDSVTRSPVLCRRDTDTPWRSKNRRTESQRYVYPQVDSTIKNNKQLKTSCGDNLFWMQSV